MQKSYQKISFSITFNKEIHRAMVGMFFQVNMSIWYFLDVDIHVDIIRVLKLAET